MSNFEKKNFWPSRNMTSSMTSLKCSGKRVCRRIQGLDFFLVATDILGMLKNHIWQRLQFVQGSPLYRAILIGLSLNLEPSDSSLQKCLSFTTLTTKKQRLCYLHGWSVIMCKWKVCCAISLSSELCMALLRCLCSTCDGIVTLIPRWQWRSC